MRLRHAARLIRGAGFPHEHQGRESGDLPFFKVGDLSRPSLGPLLTFCDNWIDRKTARLLRARAAPAGSVLLPKIGAAMLLRTRRITTRESVFDNNVLAVVPIAIESRYLRYWLEIIDLAELANPGPVPSLEERALLDLPVPVRDSVTQGEIADFLDAETARIDALIEKKRRMIDLLEERRVAVAVAEVGNPSWPRVKLALLAQLGSGHTPSRDRPDWWENVTIPWITTGDVAQMRGDRVEFIENTKLSISELGLANSAAELHPAGTVVLSRTASVGFSAIMASPMATSQDFATWTCGPRLRPRFLVLCLREMRSELLGRLAMGSTHKTIYMPDIEGIRVPLPTLEEQERVVTEVWERLRPIDAAVAAIVRQLELLREHRQALITAGVAGQVDVSRAAA